MSNIISDPRYHDLLALIKGARNGLVYGVKVRFPHALVMAIIFSRAPWRIRARQVYKATKQHATNLAKFVTIYKTLLLVQRSLNASNGGKARNLDTFFAGLLGGWFVFGERTPVNEQIVLYVVSRVVTSLLPREPGALSPAGGRARPIEKRTFQVLAAVAWGSVMWLFANRRSNLQQGMVSSMQYLYLDSETWTGLRTLLWHNK